jgi:hypothetical protein
MTGIPPGTTAAPVTVRSPAAWSGTDPGGRVGLMSYSPILLYQIAAIARRPAHPEARITAGER